MAYPVSVKVVGGDAGVDFQLLVKGYLQQFRISLEALADNFGLADGGREQAQLDAFNAHWQAICAVAEKAAGVPGNNTVVLTSADF